jgi:hypothetical protein
VLTQPRAERFDGCLHDIALNPTGGEIDNAIASALEQPDADAAIDLTDRELGTIAIAGGCTRCDARLYRNPVERREGRDGLLDAPALEVQLVLARGTDQRAPAAALRDGAIDRPLDRRLQCPLKRGLRFSTKAAVPSGASWV